MKQPDSPSGDSLFKLLIILSVPYLVLSLNHHGFLALLPFVREEFLLSRTEVGLYNTFYFLSSALLAISTGNIVDRLGSRKGILLGIGFMGAIIFMYGFSLSYEMLLGLAFFAGLGWSIITPSVNKAVLISTPVEKRAVSMGIMQSGVGIGGLAGASFLPLIGESLGWRSAIQLAALLAIIVWFFVLAFYREKQAHHSSRQPEKADKPAFIESVLALIKNKELLKICSLSLMFGMAYGCIPPHFAVYLSEDLGVSLAVAGVSLGSFQIGGIIGRPAWGMLSDRFFKGDRNKAMLVMGLIIGIKYFITGLLVFSSSISYFSVVIFAFILGFSAFGWLGVLFVSVAECAGENQVGAATGLSLLFMRTGMLIAPPIFGFIADLQESYLLSWISFGIVITFISIIGVIKLFNSTVPGK